MTALPYPEWCGHIWLHYLGLTAKRFTFDLLLLYPILFNLSRLSLDPVRDYAERKNLLPSAANFEMDIRTSVGATPRGRPETWRFIQCASVTLDPMRGCAERKNLFPSAADFEMDTRTPVGATLCGRPANFVHFAALPRRFTLWPASPLSHKTH